MFKFIIEPREGEWRIMDLKLLLYSELEATNVDVTLYIILIEYFL